MTPDNEDQVPAPAIVDDSPIHTEEMQDIIAAPPAWLIRWGIAAFFFVIVAVISTSIFIRYPDIVKCPLIISSPNVSKGIVAGSTGHLVNVLVKPEQLVNQGQPLAYVENNANHNQMLTLYEDLAAIRNGLFTGKSFSDNWLKDINVDSLGDIQPDYQSFYLSYMSNRQFIQTRNWEKLSNVIQELNKLISIVQNWKTKYVITAPKTGIIHFTQPLSPYQVVNTGQELFYISKGANKYFGEIQMPQANMGKLKVGEKVIIKVNHLPFEKYGVIEGEIATISEFPLNNGNYVLNVRFQGSDKGLLNSPNLRAGMLAYAEIVTQDVTLFSRLTSNLFKKAVDKL